jgi:hypothetical protein
VWADFTKQKAMLEQRDESINQLYAQLARYEATGQRSLRGHGIAVSRVFVLLFSVLLRNNFHGNTGMFFSEYVLFSFVSASELSLN